MELNGSRNLSDITSAALSVSHGMMFKTAVKAKGWRMMVKLERPGLFFMERSEGH